ncbi:MAG TPA: cell division protein FtsB [Wenzhouxiangella sp.]
MNLMRWVMAVLVALLVWMQFQLFQEIRQVRVLDERLEQQSEVNEELIARNDALFAEVQDLREGLDAIEERARAELGLVREGESFYLIVDPAVAGDLPSVEPALEPSPNQAQSEPQSEPTDEPSDEPLPDP